MRRALTISSLALAITGLGGPVHAAEPDSAAKSGGLTVARDPNTGRLRAPTAEEARELHEKGHKHGAQARTLSSVAPQLHLRVHQGKARSVRMTEEFMNHTVAVRGPNGEVQVDCLPSKSAAHAALSTANRGGAQRVTSQEQTR